MKLDLRRAASRRLPKRERCVPGCPDRVWSAHVMREATWPFLIDYHEHRPHNSLGGMTPAECRIHRAGISTSAVPA